MVIIFHSFFVFIIFQGHVPAFYNIGTHYFSGRGVELDMKKAAEFFKKAAELGFSMAQVFLTLEVYLI